MAQRACGIDIGGSGVKGGVVDLETGAIIGNIAKVVTPQPSTPTSVIEACHDVMTQLDVPADVPVGISFPAPVVHGTIPFMANLDQAWVGVDIASLMEQRIGHRVAVVNDADAAALGEATFGAAKGVGGVIIVTTLGTGIGSGVILDGKLLPNTELGHLEIDGYDAEKRAAASIKTAEDLTWEQYAARLQRYYSHVEMLFSPDLFVVGGGVSENAGKFLPLLKLRTPIIPAMLRNTAGIVGAACATGSHAATK
ncbi:MAG: ROK family protein [Ancrocorticia sp.]|jgi:polyphosphate glucokinase|nr:ROK family protein [Ancrocorticia sp.]MCI1933156.1 ROK family protein [Ancrocorticia sp.]MCI2178290.1 ROK family protein [Ancrocorticia sp.]MCI2193823.1 ROK family protein [Ancrocorticia sp.]MCI2198681.1 ROK family protein [Ancrocorticia sp.]